MCSRQIDLLVAQWNWLLRPGWSTSCIALAKSAANISISVKTFCKGKSNKLTTVTQTEKFSEFQGIFENSVVVRCAKVTLRVNKLWKTNTNTTLTNNVQKRRSHAKIFNTTSKSVWNEEFLFCTSTVTQCSQVYSITTLIIHLYITFIRGRRIDLPLVLLKITGRGQIAGHRPHEYYYGMELFGSGLPRSKDSSNIFGKISWTGWRSLFARIKQRAKISFPIHCTPAANTYL